LDQGELLNFVADAFDRVAVTYAVTGSHASIAYGEVRFTIDIDVVARLDSSSLDSFLQQFPRDQFYVSEDGAIYAALNGGQFNIIHPESGLKVDVIVPREAGWPDQLARRVRIATDADRRIWFVAPEDLILHKMEFFREGGSDKHLRDIAGILQITRDVDREYIWQWANKLGLGEIWSQISRRVI
jgi:hypothetical protein